MAIYHFSGQIMSRISKTTGGPKSPLACAAYRSGDKLVDEVDNKSYFYKRDVEPVTHILAPKHAPEWTSDRERLWNEVNKIEKNYNAQFAREFNVALPVELSDEDQEQLTLEFCQEAFVDRGMVADISIHRDDKSNPHFHVMLTVRPFNEDGSWGVKAKREYKFDENGNHVLDKNGKKAFDKVDTTDWNRREVFNEWRKSWAEKTNDYLKKNGINQTITHLSNEARGIEKLPTIHEGYVARKMEKEGKQSERVLINTEIKKHNTIVSELQNYKTKKEQINYQNKFIRKFSPMEKKELAAIAKELKMFVNPISIRERKEQLEKWSKTIKFTKDNESKLKQLSRIEKETEMIGKAEEILNKESERFIKMHYPSWDVDSLSFEEKVTIVDETISQNKILSDDRLDEIEQEVYAYNLEKEINNVLYNRYAFVLNLDNKVKNLSLLRNQLEKEMNINKNSFELSLKEAALKYPEKFNQLKMVISSTQEVFKAKDLMNEFYNLEIKKLYPDQNVNSFTLEEKEILIVGSEYYKQPITLNSINELSRYSVDEQVELVQLLTNYSDPNRYKEILNKYPDFQMKNPRYLMFFKDECLRNMKDLPDQTILLLKKINPEAFADKELDKSEILKDVNELMDNKFESQYEYQNESQVTSSAMLTSGVTGGILQGILDKRDKTSKSQFEEDLNSKSKKKKIHRSGPSL